MNPSPTARAGLLAIAVLAACVACSSSGSGATAAGTDADGGARPASRSIGSAMPTAGVSSTASAVHRDVTVFCARARTIGLANIAVTGGGAHTDAATLLRGIDDLDAAAPAQLKTDFHTFDKLEHTILQPSAATPPDPGADFATAMAHVSLYLSHTCGLG